MSPEVAHPAGSPVHAGATEEEQLAYALQMSALEAQSPPAVAAPAAASASEAALREREEEELAIALSLSLAETNGRAADIIDSDDESVADSDTPPNSP